HERLPRREEPTVSANRGKRPRSLGIVLEQGGHGEVEAGQQVATIEFLADLEHFIGGVALADDFDGQLRNHIPRGYLGNATIEWPTSMRNESHVRTAVKIVLEANAKQHFPDHFSQSIRPEIGGQQPDEN